MIKPKKVSVIDRWEFKKRKIALTNKALKESFVQIHDQVVSQKWINS